MEIINKNKEETQTPGYVLAPVKSYRDFVWS